LKLARVVIVVALVGLFLGAAAQGWAAPANAAPATAKGLSASQVLGEARKSYAAHDYEGALRRLEQIKADELGFFERMDYKSMLDKTRNAIPAKAADEKAFADGRQAFEGKNVAMAVEKLSQAAASDYLETDKTSAAKGLLAQARDGKAKADNAAEATRLAQAKAEADKKAKALADARKAYDARNFDEALKQLKSVKTDSLGLFEKAFTYDPLLAKAEKAIAAKAADEKALADGKADLAAKKYPQAAGKLSQAASSDYLAKDQVDAAKAALAQAKGELGSAQELKLAQAKADADKKAKAEAEAKAAQLKAGQETAAKARGEADKKAKALADARKAYDAKNFDEAVKQLKTINADSLGFFEKAFTYDRLLSKAEKAVAAKAADEKALADGKGDLAAKRYPEAVSKLSQAASSDYLAKDQADAAKAGLAQAKDEQAQATRAAEATRLAQARAEAGKITQAEAEARIAKAKAEQELAAKTAPKPAPVTVVAKPLERPAPVAVAVAVAVNPVEKPRPENPVPAAPRPVAAAAPPAPAPATVAQQAKRASAEDEMAKGAEALAAHEYEKAKIHYRKALQLWPESEKAQTGLREALRLTGEREEPLNDILRDVRSMQRGRIIAEVQDLVVQAERAMSKAERAEDYGDALRPLAQADRTIDVATVLLPEEQERLREDVYVLRKEILSRKTTAEAVRERKAAQEAVTSEAKRRTADKADRENKVRQLWERATELRKSMQFAEAIQVLERLIIVDPNDERALRWREDLEYLDAQARQVGVRDARKVGVVDVLVDTEKAATPVGEELNGNVQYLRYPTPRDWEDLTKFRREFTKAVSAEPKAVSETRRRLSETIDLDFEKTSLDNVLKYISEVQRGLNIVIDPDITAAGVDLTTRVVDLKVKRVSIESVLGLILGADLGYKVEAGYLLITTKDKLQQNLPVVTYPVQDLVAQIPQFDDQAPRFEVATVLQQAASASGGGAGGLFGGGAAAAPADQPVGSQELTAIIQRTVSNQSDPAVAAWSDEGGPAAIEYMNGLLIITQTRRGHEKVADLLDQLRRERAIMISVESRFCQVSDQFLQDITLDLDVAFLGSDRFAASNMPIFPPGGNQVINQPVRLPDGTIAVDPTGAPIYADQTFRAPSASQPIIITNTGSTAAGTRTLLPLAGTAFSNFGLNDGGLAVSGVFLDEIQVGFLLRAIQADVRSTVLQAPRITLYNGQRSYISVSTVMTYIADAEPVVAEAAVGWDLQISAIPVGVTLDVKATVSADRRYVQMDLRPQSAQLDTSVNPTGFQTYPISAAVPGGIATFTIELPRVMVQDFKTTVSVPDGGTLLLGGTRRFSESDVETGVPILSKVPILKRLFNNRASLRSASNLLILIKPKVIIQAEEEHRLGYDNF
jgi:type II secretory pathway component GspD/PulD (secretin)